MRERKVEPISVDYKIHHCIEAGESKKGTFIPFCKLEIPNIIYHPDNLVKMDYYKQHCNPKKSLFKRIFNK